MNSARAWIVAAAVGWALAIFAGGILVGTQLDDDDPATSRQSAGQGSGAAVAVQRETAREPDPAHGAPLRVALRDVRGELAIGSTGSRGGGEPRRAGPGGGSAGAQFVAGRSRSGGARASSPAVSPAPSARPRAQRRARRRSGRRGGQRRRAHRRSRPPAPPAAPLAPFVAPPPPQRDRHRGHGRGHDDDGHRGHGHDRDDDGDDDHDDD